MLESTKRSDNSPMITNPRIGETDEERLIRKRAERKSKMEMLESSQKTAVKSETEPTVTEARSPSADKSKPRATTPNQMRGITTGSMSNIKPDTGESNDIIEESQLLKTSSETSIVNGMEELAFFHKDDNGDNVDVEDTEAVTPIISREPNVPSGRTTLAKFSTSKGTRAVQKPEDDAFGSPKIPHGRTTLNMYGKSDITGDDAIDLLASDAEVNAIPGPVVTRGPNIPSGRSTLAQFSKTKGDRVPLKPESAQEEGIKKNIIPHGRTTMKKYSDSASGSEKKNKIPSPTTAPKPSITNANSSRANTPNQMRGVAAGSMSNHSFQPPKERSVSPSGKASSSSGSPVRAASPSRDMSSKKRINEME